ATAGVRPNLSRHQALSTWPEAHEDALPGTQFGQTEAPQRLHVHEDVLCAFAAGKEAVSADAVEPFDDRAFETAGRGDDGMGTWRRRLRRTDRGRLVHADDTERLQPLRTVEHFGDDARAF